MICKVPESKSFWNSVLHFLTFVFFYIFYQYEYHIDICNDSCLSGKYINVGH